MYLGRAVRCELLSVRYREVHLGSAAPANLGLFRRKQCGLLGPDVEDDIVLKVFKEQQRHYREFMEGMKVSVLKFPDTDVFAVLSVLSLLIAGWAYQQWVWL